MTKTFTLVIAILISSQLFAQGGTLNTQFNGGTITTSFGADHSGADDIIVQLDGKIVAAGYAIINSVSNFTL
jgi:C4-dicarboxylate transporter